MIKCTNIYKSYKNKRTKNYKKNKDKEVFKNASLFVKEGELVYLTGKSGTGKSTLIKLLTKQESVNSGLISVNGVEISSLKKAEDIQRYRRMIGVIYQDYQLIQEMTVFDNLKFVLEYLGEKNQTLIKKKIEMVCEDLDIKDTLYRKVETLSGGEQQRVAIARAIINNPKVILADEPTGNLDHNTKKEIINIFNKINSRGTTIVIVTHDESIIKSTPHKVYCVNNGRITHKTNAI